MQARTTQRQNSKERALQAQSSVAVQTKAGPSGNAAMLMSLQRSHGNRFVQRMLEATVLQRDCGCGGTCSGCSSKQLESSPVPSVVNEVLSSSGQPLDASARAFMEPRFGRDFHHVRIHTGQKASESAEAVSALAYTVGPNIVFAAGQYNPASHEGRRLLAHELAHTLQQSGTGPGPISGISQPGDVGEREADRAAESVMRLPDSGLSMAVQKANAIADHAVRLSGPHAGAPSLDEAAGDGLQRKCAQCAEEDKDVPRAEAVQSADDEREGFHSDYPPMRPPAEVLAEADEEEPLAPAVRAPGSIQRIHVIAPAAAGAPPATLAAAAMAVQPRAGSAGMLQRWSVDGPADPDTNTIVCNGSGGIRVQLAPDDPEWSKCVGDCVTEHEKSHRSDALKANPNVCKGAADGSQLIFGTGETSPSEIKASNVEINCLRSKIFASKKCKPHIKTRIKQMKEYRDSFK